MKKIDNKLVINLYEEGYTESKIALQLKVLQKDIHTLLISENILFDETETKVLARKLYKKGYSIESIRHYLRLTYYKARYFLNGLPPIERNTRLKPLSNRSNSQIIFLLNQGMCENDIAKELGISGTVVKHIANTTDRFEQED